MNRSGLPLYAYTRLQLLNHQRPDGVEDGQDHDAHVGEDGGPHVGLADGDQQQAGQLDANGEDNVLVDDPQALPGDLHGLGDLHGVVVHEHHIGGLNGGVGAHGTHGNADVRPGEHRGIVNAVAYEGQLALVLSGQELLYLGDLVSGEQGNPFCAEPILACSGR